MKGGALGSTDWNALETAPLPEHYDDFADLATTIARRYPDVKHFIVWNELKGFYDPIANNWDIAAYTRLYNKVYDALKAVDPSIQVGGPYVRMNSWSTAKISHPSDVRGDWGVLDQRSLDAITYWLANAHGADFIAVDGGTGNRDRPAVATTITQTAKFAAVNQWISQRTSLPIWWAEMHLGDVDADDPATPALLRSALREQAASGAAVVLLWQPEGTSNACRLCMWTSAQAPGGGEPTATYRSLATLLQHQPITASQLSGPPPGHALMDLPPIGVPDDLGLQPARRVNIPTS
jgi:hypothetical protein